jgi:hypothetical protein
MPHRLILIGTVLGILLPPTVARAVIIFLKEGGQEIRARLVRESPELVVIAVPQPDGTCAEQVLRHEDIEDIIRTVSKDRLAALKKDNPQAYRDYAEELAGKRKDPDARATALQLYHIAAYLDPERLGRSCLLGMADLARTPAEERKFRAMVYLLDPEHDTRSLKTVDRPAEQRPALTPGDADSLVKCLRLARRDLGRNALTESRRDNVKAAFAHIKHILTYDEFVEMCKPGKPLSPGQLRRVLLAEASLIRVIGHSDELPEEKPPAKSISWSRVMAVTPPTPIPSLSLETLTEHDPAKCEYRDGDWVKPE